MANESKTLFDIADNENQQETNVAEQGQKEPPNASDEPLSNLSEWYYDDKIKGNGEPPEWFNNKTFKNITEQARAYNEARKKLNSFSGAPEQYEEFSNNKDNTFAAELKELGKKIGLNQAGFNELLNTYNKTKAVEAEREHSGLLQKQKEELKRIGGVTKLKELEAKFIDAFGDTTVSWLKNSIRSYDDYANLERIVSRVSDKTRLPLSSAETIPTLSQAEELIRDPRWGRDKEFAQKVDKLFYSAK